MKKIKEVWDKLKYWQKGGVAGLIIGIVYYLYLLVDSFKNRADACNELFSCANVTEYFISFVPIVLIFFLYGSLMGWFLGKLSIKKENKKEKTVKYTLFLVILIISFFILYYLILIHIRVFTYFLFNPPY